MLKMLKVRKISNLNQDTESLGEVLSFNFGFKTAKVPCFKNSKKLKTVFKIVGSSEINRYNCIM